MTETAVFSNVELDRAAARRRAKPVVYSTLETQTIASTDRRVVHVTPSADSRRPTGSRDGKTLIYNSGGRIYRIPAAGGEAASRSTPASPRGATTTTASRPTARCWSSATSRRASGSRCIYTLPIAGGTPKLVTPTGPSYWHGWSPDGKTLAYCAERDGEFDIYTIPVDGGAETRLTTAKGLDDGPEYSPDGKHIYFNSDRTGRMQIWRMQADGSEQEQVTAGRIQQLVPAPVARRPDGWSSSRTRRT